MTDIDSILPARAMGISRLSGEPGHFSMPFAGNTNAKATVFAGAIFSLAAVSGYETASERQEELSIKGDLFLYSSRIIYHEPGLTDLNAKSRIVKDFATTRRGNFRIEVEVHIYGKEGGSILADFGGVYVVRAPTAP
jgi:thioesterase domain-containing protein